VGLNVSTFLGSEDAGTAHLLDLPLGQLAEELGLDHHRLSGQLTLAQHLEDAVLSHINHWGSAGGLGSSQASL
jgi:hypothetical protein